MLFKNSLLVLLPFCFLLGDFTVLHSTLFETTFFCLNADVEHFSVDVHRMERLLAVATRTIDPSAMGKAVSFT